MDKRRTSRTIRVSQKTASGLSEYRKAELTSQIERGIIKEGGGFTSKLNKTSQSVQAGVAFEGPDYRRGGWDAAPGGGVSSGSYNLNGHVYGNSKNALAAVAHSAEYRQNPIRKNASISTGSVSSGGATGLGGVERLLPEVYSPLFMMANLNLPRDRVTINSWIRNFYTLHPIVRNAITLHATYPISKLNLKCHDKKVLQFFEDMVEDMRLMESLGELSLEFWLMGEVFPFMELNEDTGKWHRMVIHNPDYVHVKKAVLAGEPMISLKPDSVLQRIVMSNNPVDVQLRKQIPENIQHYVRKGHAIPLDNFNVSHLKMLAAPYDVRGTSIVVSVFKDLMLYDKLRECKFAQADDLVNPLTVVKVGGSADGEYRATQEDLNFYKNILEEATYDKNFKLITHAGVEISRVGSNGAVLEVASDFEMIMKNIYTGLMVPPSVVESDASSYSSASIGLEVLRQRYFNFRNMMANWLQSKVFAPISEIHNFTEYKDGTRRLIVPEIEWNQLNLYDLQDYIGNITGLLSQKQVSLQTVYKSLGLNYEDEKVKQRQEMIDQAILLKEQEAISMMSLTELRSLDPEKPVSEPIDDLQRAKGPSAGGGGAEMAPDLGGMPELAPPTGGELGGAPPTSGGLGGPGGAPPSIGPGL